MQLFMLIRIPHLKISKVGVIGALLEARTLTKRSMQLSFRNEVTFFLLHRTVVTKTTETSRMMEMINLIILLRLSVGNKLDLKRGFLISQSLYI